VLYMSVGIGTRQRAVFQQDTRKWLHRSCPATYYFGDGEQHPLLIMSAEIELPNVVCRMTRNTDNTEEHIETNTTPDSLNTDLLHIYLKEGDPVPHILRRTLYLAVPATTLLLFLTQFVPGHLDLLDDLSSGFAGDLKILRPHIDEWLRISASELLEHTLLITYISLYISMWWVYFQSRISDDEGRGRMTRPLRVQSLRRLLGYSSLHWDNKPARSEQLVDTYQKKGSAGMQVLAILIAVSLLIIDKIVDILPFSGVQSRWKQAILWLGLMSSSISFIGFVLCVDSFDTMFNRFKTDTIRNIMVHHFYKYTINPRYVATACMLFALIMLLAYYSEIIASLAIGVLVVAGFRFWFPDLYATCRHLYNCSLPETRNRRYNILSTLLIAIPLVMQTVLIFWLDDA